jgi:hypothetical protein
MESKPQLERREHAIDRAKRPSGDLAVNSQRPPDYVVLRD